MSRQELLARFERMARVLAADPSEVLESTRRSPRPRQPARPARRPRATATAPLDRLVEASAAINRIKSEAAAIAAITRLTERQVEDRFRLGGLLCKLRDRRWFGGYPSFARLVERRFGVRKSTAYKAICVYEVLMELCVDWVAVKDLGIAKLSLLCAKVASGELPRHAFSTRVAGARAMSFRELAAAFPRKKRPPYLLKSRPERTVDDVLLWMRINGAENVLTWFRQAFPSWRPADVTAFFAQAESGARNQEPGKPKTPAPDS